VAFVFAFNLDYPEFVWIRDQPEKVGEQLFLEIRSKHQAKLIIY